MDEKQIIQQIIDLKDEEIDKFIEQRIAELEKTATEDREQLSPFSIMMSRSAGVRENPEVVGYIPEKVHIAKRGMDISSFILNDKSFYKTMINYIKEAKPNSVKAGDRVNNNYIMLMVQCAIINYFGLNATDRARDALYDSKTDIENDDCTLSISDFKNNHTGMCVERSAVAQNILAFLGYNPMMIYGFASNEKDGTNVGHAFNCIIRNGKGMLIDFSNPIYKNGKFLKPAMFPINQENMQQFMRGKGNIEVQHKDLCQENGIEKEDVTTWVYSSEEIDPKYFEEDKGDTAITPQDITQSTKKIGLQDINGVIQDTKQFQNQKTIAKDQQIFK